MNFLPPSVVPKREFHDEAAAKQWLEDRVDDPYIDNFRFAFADDEQGMVAYNDLYEGGCCGSADYEVVVQGRAAWVGCNYGH